MIDLPDTPQEWAQRLALAFLLLVAFGGLYLQADRLGQRLGGARKPRWPWERRP